MNGPSLTEDMVLDTIMEREFIVRGSTTICMLTLVNGFTVIAMSAPVSASNFNAEMGEQIAEKKATEKVWELEGYLLKQGVFEREMADSVRSE